MKSGAEPIRVLHIIHELGDGGADRALSRLANASDPACVLHTILSLRRGRGYGTMRRGVTMLYAGIGESGQARTLKALLRRRFDLVHGWTPYASIMAAQIAGALGVPLIQRQPTNIEMELQYEAAYASTYWRELRLAHAAADAVIVPSTALVDCTRRLCGVKEPVVIPNSIDVDKVPAWRPRPRAGRPFEFGFAGRLCRQKDPMTLIEALPHLPASLDWRLRIFGDGYLRQPVEARVDALGVRDRVLFEEFDEEWVSAGFDAFVFPTRYEGMSNALLEAAAAGMPIVASAIPENCVVLEDGKHAILAPAGDPVAFAHAMTRIAAEPGFGEVLGACAREHARSFSFDAMVKAHEALYLRLARPGATRQAA